MCLSIHSALTRLQELLGRGEFDDALRQAKQAVAQTPGLPWAWHLLATAQYQKGDMEGAEASAKRAAQGCPGNALHHFLYAAILCARGKFGDAEAALDAAIELRKDWGLAWHKRGVVRFRERRFVAASDDLARAAQLLPQCPEAHYNAAIALAAARRWPECQDALTRCATIDAEWTRACAKLLVAAGKLEAVEDAYSHIHRIKNLVGVLTQRMGRLVRRITPALSANHRDQLGRLLAEHNTAYEDVAATLKAIAVQPLALECADVGEIIRRCLFAASANIATRQVITRLAPAIPKVCCDPGKVQEALLNVLVNGCEATTADDVLTISCWHDSNTVSIAVADTGIGIPASAIDDVFQMGYTTKPHGTGFGLAYVKQVIERHGGAVQAQSTEGEGSVFALELPIKPRVSDDLTSFQLRPLPHDTVAALLGA